MEATELLSRLGRELGLSLHISDEGVCRIYFDNDTIDFEMIDDGVCIIAEVGYLPPQGCERQCRALLAANLFGIETAGATLSLDAAIDTVFLHMIYRNNSNYYDFEAAIGRFLKVLRHWKGQLRTRSLQEEEQSVPAYGLKV